MGSAREAESPHARTEIKMTKINTWEGKRGCGGPGMGGGREGGVETRLRVKRKDDDQGGNKR